MKYGKWMIMRAVDMSMAVIRDAKCDPSTLAALRLHTIRECDIGIARLFALKKGRYHRQAVQPYFDALDKMYNSLAMAGYLTRESDHERALLKPRKQVT